MPTYNYRLTGRDIRTMSPVESSDRVLLWGSDSIHCSYPGCRFEICGVGGENVMGGAMQEGWGIRDFSPDCPAEATPDPQTPDIGAMYERGPWRCALHRTEEHHDISPEMIAEHCGPKHPEYLRGHADGFEAAQKTLANAPKLALPGNMMEIPGPDDIVDSLKSAGGLTGLGPQLLRIIPLFSRNDAFADGFADAAEQLGLAPGLAMQFLVIGIVLSSNWFNQKYANQIEAEHESRSVQ